MWEQSWLLWNLIALGVLSSLGGRFHGSFGSKKFAPSLEGERAALGPHGQLAPALGWKPDLALESVCPGGAGLAICSGRSDAPGKGSRREDPSQTRVSPALPRTSWSTTRSWKSVATPLAWWPWPLPSPGSCTRCG